MSTLSKAAVVQAFLADHKKFMRLLVDVSDALQRDDLAAARTLATQLNTVAGPHIAFEETVLYPALDDASHDHDFVEGLYDEHQQIVTALAELISNDSLTKKQLTAITHAFQSGTEHAEHCGTLISRLSNMDAADQRDALDDLIQLQEQEILWTDLKKEA